MQVWVQKVRAQVRDDTLKSPDCARAAAANVNQATTEDGTTPLFIASQGGHLKVVQGLVAAGADVNQDRPSLS